MKSETGEGGFAFNLPLNGGEIGSGETVGPVGGWWVGGLQGLFPVEVVRVDQRTRLGLQGKANGNQATYLFFLRGGGGEGGEGGEGGWGMSGQASK